MKLNGKFKTQAGIYIIKNKVNGKIYVGESKNIQKRMNRHKLSSGGQPFHSAIKKYGIEAFDVYVEYLPNFSKEDLWILEEQLIKNFNSICPNGYNICAKGKGITGYKFSPESRQKMSEARRGKKFSEEHKQKISASLTGRTVSDITKKKNSEIRKGRPLNENFKKAAEKSWKANCKPIIQKNAETLEVISTWNSIADAAESLTGNRKQNSAIRSCLIGICQTAYGFKWEYVTDLVI